MGIRILKGGMLTTVQDLGRNGYQSQGFSVAGVMDVRSFKIANLLLDNPENEAVLEFTLIGPTLEFTSATIIAITSFTDSFLYKESDVAATVFADEVTYPVEAVSARVAHICLVDSLAMLLATYNYDSFANHIKSRNDVLEGIRY